MDKILSLEMSQLDVSDSEDEPQAFSLSDISQERLKSALRQRKALNNDLQIKETVCGSPNILGSDSDLTKFTANTGPFFHYSYW